MNRFALIAALKDHFGHDDLTIVDDNAVIDEKTGETFDVADLPLVYPVEFSRAAALEKMRAVIDEFMARFTGGLNDAEVASWTKKAIIARAYLDGSATPANIAAIEGEAAFRKVTGATLARKIVEKDEQYPIIIGMVSGLRAATETAIGAAQDDGAVWAAVEASRARAKTEAAKFGLDFP